jgi:hypothetical protein
MSDSDVTGVCLWDVEGFRAAVSRLDAVVDRLPGVRQRFDDVVRALWSGDVWSGPSATAAAGALSRLSAVNAIGCADLDDSLRQLRLAVTEAAEAQEAALEAGGVAMSVNSGAWASVPPELDDPSGLLQAARLEAARDRARRHAADAVAAAERADEEVPDRDAITQPAPVSWRTWLDGVPGRHQVDVPLMPTAAVAADTAAWWSGMSPAQQWAAIARDPSAVGALPGVSAWARDRANRLVLARAMAIGDDASRDTATAVAQEIADRETAGEQVQLLELDVEEGLVALGLGDLDTAESIGVLVPGMDNDVASDLDGLADDANAVADAAQTAAPGLAVATVAWMSYRTPSGLKQAGRLPAEHARAGGRALDATLDGLAAARVTNTARVTVLAHSYGSVVTDRAVDEPGELAADAVVVLGSPGMNKDADEMEVDEVYEASSPRDLVSQFQYFGNATWEDDFGAERLPTDWDTGHSDYYDTDRPTVAAMGEVMAGMR